MARYNQNKLTVKQQIFCDEWLLDGNALRAYRAAFSKKCSDTSARAQASKTLTNPNVGIYIKRRQAELAVIAEASQERVVLEERRIAFCDIRGLFQGGQILSPEKLPEELARAVSNVEVTEKPNGEITYKYRFWDKGRALERLLKHLGLYEKDNQQRGITFEQLIGAVKTLDSKFADRVIKELTKNLQN